MNTIKTFFLLMVLTGLLLVVGAMFGGEFGIIMALGFALMLNVGAYWFSDRIALGMTHARPVTEQDDPELYGLVAEQANLAGLPMPKVYEIQSDSPNAFATGRNPQHASVAATTGIRRLLTREELGAVMAHEMANPFGEILDIGIDGDILTHCPNAIDQLLHLLTERHIRDVRMRPKELVRMLGSLDDLVL